MSSQSNSEAIQRIKSELFDVIRRIEELNRYRIDKIKELEKLEKGDFIENDSNHA